VFAQLHFNKPEWLDILGGRKMLRNTPLIQELEVEFKREERTGAIIDVLEGRFQAVTPEITAGLKHVAEHEALARLTRLAGVCADLRAFEEALRQELPQQPPASTRGGRKPRKAKE
jgi:hypothetical protein